MVNRIKPPGVPGPRPLPGGPERARPEDPSAPAAGAPAVAVSDGGFDALRPARSEGPVVAALRRAPPTSPADVAGLARRLGASEEGPPLRAALRAFQASAGLAPTGALGLHTLRALARQVSAGARGGDEPTLARLGVPTPPAAAEPSTAPARRLGEALGSLGPFLTFAAGEPRPDEDAAATAARLLRPLGPPSQPGSGERVGPAPGGSGLRDDGWRAGAALEFLLGA